MKPARIIKHAVLTAIEIAVYYALNNEKLPLSVSLYGAMVACNVGLILPSIALVISFLRYKSLVMMADAFVTVAGAAVLWAIYKKNGKRPGVESILFIFLSQVVYVTLYDGNILNKLLYTSIITVFYFTCQVAVNTAVYKNVVAKPNFGEVLSVGVTFAVCSLGIIMSFGENVYKCIAVFTLIFSVRLYKSPSALTIACFLALPQCIFTGDLGYVALYGAAFFAAYIFAEYPAILSAAAVVGSEVAFAHLLNFFSDYGYIEALFTVVPACIAAFIPSSAFEKLTENGYMGGDRLTRGAIARIKCDLSGKLYDLAGAFSEVDGALKVLSSRNEQKKAAVKKISAACVARACDKCSEYRVCTLAESDSLVRLVELGTSKGRLTLVDLPKDFMDGCINPNPLIFEINRLIDVYLDRMEQFKRADEIKNILSLSALGIEKRLNDLAFEMSQSAPQDRAQEKKLVEHLMRRGIKTFGVMVCGESAKTIDLIVAEKLNERTATECVNEFTKTAMIITSVQKIQSGLKFMEFKKAPLLDAAFGVSSVTKHNSEKSGDVHSLLRLSDNKFLVALSDGMGSGENALSTSSAAIGLIEGMLKAGIRQNVVLPIVNEIVSVTTEDNFSAIDIGIVDLIGETFDFIKIGAPYGFILSKDGIRFIEGSSLPIGILSELKPTTAHAGAQSGDILMMLSDGITDAFGSSTDFIEFLKSAPTKNPQALSDSVLEEALSRTGGIAEDDMTCLCVRLFENQRVA